MARKLPQGKRLDRAMKSAGMDRSELARRLAARADFNAKPASVYRTIKRWISGDLPITVANQAAIEEELSLPAGYLYEEDVKLIRQRTLEQRVGRLEQQLLDLHRRLVELRKALP